MRLSVMCYDLMVTGSNCSGRRRTISSGKSVEKWAPSENAMRQRNRFNQAVTVTGVAGGQAEGTARPSLLTAHLTLLSY
jgi:hypothetical protein